ncbi:TPA: hypothetical protein ACSTJY_004583 [Serratia fonticola]|uniref:hypothetical protein n=1 Tax=Serratia fonticola TaxID=47917 RepID=UPI0034C60CCC
MKSDYKVLSMTPANPGWWLRYEDEQGRHFYYPVAVWAQCAVVYPGGEEEVADEWLHPMTADVHGLLSVPELTGSRLLYLPDTRFIPVISGNALAYYEKAPGSGDVVGGCAT